MMTENYESFMSMFAYIISDAFFQKGEIFKKMFNVANACGNVFGK